MATPVALCDLSGSWFYQCVSVCIRGFDSFLCVENFHRRCPMGRGAQQQTQAHIDQQLAQQNAMNQQIYSTSQGLGSQATAGYQNLVANPGYTDAEKSAITNLSQS